MNLRDGKIGIAACAGIVALVAGCGGGGGDGMTSSATPAESSTAAAAAAAEGGPGRLVKVDIAKFAFAPGEITVKRGSKIEWANSDSAPHTATADDKSFDTGTLMQGASGSATFDSPGTVPYVCSIHPFMHGTVVVE
jgi:plastocyanin